MKIKIYVVTGEKPIGGATLLVGYPSYQSARQAMETVSEHAIGPSGLNVEEQDYILPDDAIPDGSTISVELHIGGSEDDDGIHTGGGWLEVVGMAHIDHIDLWSNRIQGHVSEIGTDKFMVNMPLHVGMKGYPYRNARIIRARTSLEDGSY